MPICASFKVFKNTSVDFDLKNSNIIDERSFDMVTNKVAGFGNRTSLLIFTPLFNDVFCW